MRISESAHTGLVIVACQKEVDLRFRSRICPMASDDDQLIQVRIIFLIVRQRCHTQLQGTHHYASLFKVDIALLFGDLSGPWLW